MIITVTMNPAIDKTVEIEKFVCRGLNRIRKVEYDAGGKGINVAKVSSALGESVVALGFMGGASGNFAKKQLEELGIATSFTVIERETRTNVNISDENGISGEILEEGPEVSAEEEKQFFANLRKIWYTIFD